MGGRGVTYANACAMVHVHVQSNRSVLMNIAVNDGPAPPPGPIRNAPLTKEGPTASPTSPRHKPPAGARQDVAGHHHRRELLRMPRVERGHRAWAERDDPGSLPRASRPAGRGGRAGVPGAGPHCNGRRVDGADGEETQLKTADRRAFGTQPNVGHRLPLGLIAPTRQPEMPGRGFRAQGRGPVATDQLRAVLEKGLQHGAHQH